LHVMPIIVLVTVGGSCRWRAKHIITDTMLTVMGILHILG
jgi:hypothetical protein